MPRGDRRAAVVAEHGVWRGFDNCRMRTNEEPEFCLVCKDALTRLIDFYTK